MMTSDPMARLELFSQGSEGSPMLLRAGVHHPFVIEEEAPDQRIPLPLG